LKQWIGLNSNLYAISSMIVLPIDVAPPLNTAKTAGAVDVAAEWVLAQSGFPNPVTCPSTSNLLPKIQDKISTANCREYMSLQKHTHWALR